MENMVELYSPFETERLAKKAKIGTALMCAVLALGLAGCVLLCKYTTTANAARMEVAAIVTATVSGWVALWLWAFVVRTARAEAAHAQTMLIGERERLTGRVTVTRERVWIRGNITLRTVYVSTHEGLRRVSVNERKVKALKGAGELLTLDLVGGYIAAYGPAEPGPGAGEPPAGIQAPPEDGRKGLGWKTSALGKFLSQIYPFILWALACTFFWSWVFTRVTDTAPENKVTVFVDAYTLEDTALAVELETDLPKGIRMVKVHPVSYVMMDGKDLQTADIFLLRESDIETYRDYLAPEGTVIYDAATGTGAAQGYILYAPAGGSGEDCYLFYGANSLHTGEQDTAALEVAKHLMELK